MNELLTAQWQNWDRLVRMRSSSSTGRFICPRFGGNDILGKKDNTVSRVCTCKDSYDKELGKEESLIEYLSV